MTKKMFDLKKKSNFELLLLRLGANRITHNKLTQNDLTKYSNDTDYINLVRNNCFFN